MFIRLLHNINNRNNKRKESNKFRPEIKDIPSGEIPCLQWLTTYIYAVNPGLITVTRVQNVRGAFIQRPIIITGSLLIRIIQVAYKITNNEQTYVASSEIFHKASFRYSSKYTEAKQSEIFLTSSFNGPFRSHASSRKTKVLQRKGNVIRESKQPGLNHIKY